MSDETKTVSISPEDVSGCAVDNGTDVMKTDGQSFRRNRLADSEAHNFT
jgi:hypothetical protein